MFDTLEFETAVANLDIPAGTEFQTKSLYAGLERFTITSDGRLVQHLYRYETDVGNARNIAGRRVAVGDEELAFHGDILLIATNAAIHPAELVARFTHGRLEWIRPSNDCPEVTKRLLLNQSSR